MKQIVEQLLFNALEVLKSTGKIPPATQAEIKIERSKNATHGDFASNLALLLAKSCQQSPREVAAWLLEAIPAHPALERVDIAGPGFINFFMHKDTLSQVIPRVLMEKERYGSSQMGQLKRIIIEFVSANPTGPLHVGHGRSAAFGASLANVLKAAGFGVSCEYYVNDAGRQMDILAVSVWLRYVSLGGENIVFPANAYQGDYVQVMAQTLLAEKGTLYLYPWTQITEGLPLDEPEGGDKELYIDAMISKARKLLGDEGFKRFHQYALQTVLADIKDDLGEFGVHFDHWFSEQSLVDSGALEKGIDALKTGGHTYLKDGALWFKATAFDDEKDRVLIRANGQSTYFASDVAYHWNKYDRGFERVIDIFGADHHGYTTRVKAAVKALGHDEQCVDVLLVQFAILYRGGQRVQMSTRSGSFVTLRELRDEVGNDAARFFYVMRKPEQHMDFDLDLAKSQSNDNPVYYIQYAHARICSVLNQLKERGLHFNESMGIEHLSELSSPHELDLMTLMSRYPEVIANAAMHCEPHQMAYYLRELANGLHSYYNAVQLLCENDCLRSARLCLLMAVSQVLKNGLHLLGVCAPESM